MLIGPLKPPQFSKVPFVKPTENSGAANDEETLQTVLLPHSNCMVVLTTRQVLIYNYKPMALVATNTRSIESFEEYGENKAVFADAANSDLFCGIVPDAGSTYAGLHQRKTTFYVVSERNFVFVFQVLLGSSPATILKETGIPIVDIQSIDPYFGQELVDNSDESDALTVFDKFDTHKVIQNGYAVEKQQGFLHFLTGSSDNVDEIPIKRIELRLRIILKFEHNILDFAGLCEVSMEDNGDHKEYLLVLFPHGLQILELQNFKLKDTSLIKVTDGLKLLQHKDSLCVVSQISGQIIINRLDLGEKIVHSDKLSFDTESPLIDAFSRKDALVLVFKTEVVSYNFKDDKVIKRYKALSEINSCEPVTQEASIILTKNGISFLTEFCNYIFSTLDNDNNDNELDDFANFTSFISLGGTLVCTSRDGRVAKWDLWVEASSPFSDMRYPKPFILLNDFNDIMLFSPTPESSRNVPFQIIKLPTQTINNYVPLLKANGPVTMLAAYVSNKNILLIHNLVSNEWHSFPDMIVLEMNWFGSDLLLCHVLDEERNELLKCYHMPPQVGPIPDLGAQILWEYAIPSSSILRSVHVNTLSKYRLLKVTSKNPDDDDIESMFKIAEIVLQNSVGELRVIDVISKINADGSSKVKLFHQLPVQKLTESFAEAFDWVLGFNGGFLSYSLGSIVKWNKQGDSEEWSSEIVLDKVERMLDVVDTKAYFVQEDSVLVFSLDDLWNKKGPIAKVAVNENDYPVAISYNAAIIHSVQFVFTRNLCKVVPHQTMYLDQVINHLLQSGASSQDIDARYHSLNHYKFSLEKILSSKVLTNEPLQSIVELINYYDQGPKFSGRLEIISNCLRKIEVEHWDYLFKEIKLTPRDLLVQCVEQDEAKALGVLLMVFLNYDGGKRGDHPEVKPISKPKRNKRNKNRRANTNHPHSGNVSSVSTIFNDEELMVQVLKILVNAAASSTEPEQAREFWDLSFQLVRFIHALDIENKTSLVEDAMKLIT
ncbi:LAQU0S07e01750g1_1 [Lachancea quebecensis]|uniref:LAQU0S07e01750g1_1 n=1 Tax=Lachancea quebecensis TaxID=1654605 RepID=A0A0P1KSV8_9SACH|nr:LAQU0S07e01750g1_1 [Lachancea quebecensis]